MRTFHVGAVAILWLLLALGPAQGQENKVAPAKEKTKPAPKQLILTVGSTHALQMTTKQRIKTVFNDNPDVIEVIALFGDPTRVRIKALKPGRARLTLIGEDGKKEVHHLGKPSANVALAQP